MLLQVLLCVALVLSLVAPAAVAGASRSVPLPDKRPLDYSTVDTPVDVSAMALNAPQRKVMPMVVAGCTHIVGLRSDGTVVVLARTYGRGSVGGWKDMDFRSGGIWSFSPGPGPSLCSGPAWDWPLSSS